MGEHGSTANRGLDRITVPGNVTGVVSGGRVMSHALLEEQVAKAAGGLAARGVGQGDCVAILMRNDPVFLVASFAAMRLGAYAVPLNWHFKGEEVGYILRDCAAKVFVGHTDLLAAVAEAVPERVAVIDVPPPPEVRAAYVMGEERRLPRALGWEAFLGESQPWTGPPVPPTQSMIYTSGTTGNPKGVRRAPPNAEQQAALERMRVRTYGMVPGSRALLPGPLYHSAPNSFAVRGARIAGVMVLMPRFDPIELLETIERYRIEITFMVPTMFVRLLKLPEEVRRRYDVSSLRFVMHAAAPCAPDVKRRMIDWWGPVINEFYGATESGAVTIVSSQEWLARPGTVGRPVEGASVRIYDDAGALVPAGGVGEVYTRLDPFNNFTYHNLPEKRREIDRDGHITCGDVGYLDPEGYLFLCDRKRDMVISGGVNIYPAEIEAAAHTMPGVRDCAVFGVPDDEFGEALIALVEPVAGSGLTVEAFRAHLAAHLADYKVPRKIELRAELPREDSGKIFKRKLREPYWQGAGRRI
ncbi:MAG TPA: acyl-CoA synthetase [Hyphomicrobiaceae bacterium]|nr:acyl-CoA synthetase [Hyphomicrobiaceae bacterium]